MLLLCNFVSRMKGCAKHHRRQWGIASRGELDYLGEVLLADAFALRGHSVCPGEVERATGGSAGISPQEAQHGGQHADCLDAYSGGVADGHTRHASQSAAQPG